MLRESSIVNREKICNHDSRFTIYNSRFGLHFQ